MQIFRDEIACRHPNDNITMVLDGAGCHKSTEFQLPDNLRLLFLPPYSPELNPQEHLWDELREKHFHNRVFDSIDALEDQLVSALRNLEDAPDRVQSMTARDWITNAVSIANLNFTSKQVRPAGRTPQKRHRRSDAFLISRNWLD